MSKQNSYIGDSHVLRKSLRSGRIKIQENGEGCPLWKDEKCDHWTILKKIHEAKFYHWSCLRQALYVFLVGRVGGRDTHPTHPKHTESLSQAYLNTCHFVAGCFHNIITFAYIPCGQVEEKTCLSADELARIVGLSVIIAKQRFVIVIVIRGVLGLVWVSSNQDTEGIVVWYLGLR